MPTTNATPVMRFLTLGGAHVAVTGSEFKRDAQWRCLGCDQHISYRVTLAIARREANEHAGLCRSIPKTTD